VCSCPSPRQRAVSELKEQVASAAALKSTLDVRIATLTAEHKALEDNTAALRTEVTDLRGKRGNRDRDRDCDARSA
jgi:hypothetical protein